MSKVRTLVISGFRGMLAPLTLDLTSNGKPVSTLLYGRNGTGKSSITDAWEWLRAGKIEHLGREGAGHASYAHLAAKPGQSYIEAQFVDPALGKLRLELDHDRVTRPKATGAFSQFRTLTPHPCHIRFADLTRFVYLTKSERYDLLAQFMGFIPQVETQKALRRTQSKFQETCGQQAERAVAAHSALNDRVGLVVNGFAQLADALTPLLARYAIARPASIGDVAAASQSLRLLVQSDPNAVLLASLKGLAALVGKIAVAPEVVRSIQAFVEAAIPFKEKEDQVKGLLLLDLYQQGLAALAVVDDKAVCPLCRQRYPEDLEAHLTAELEALKTLKADHDRTLALLKGAQVAITKATLPVSPIEEARRNCPDLVRAEIPRSILEHLDALNKLTSELAHGLDLDLRELTTAALQVLRDLTDSLKVKIDTLTTERDLALGALDSAITACAADEARIELVNTYELMAAVSDLYPRYVQSLSSLLRYKEVGQELDGHIEDYVATCLADVERRFAQISVQVATFFEILEIDTTGLGTPVLHILEDQDRSVVPEVTFHGRLVSPAYKFLSESQLNSFGLAVFLASVLRFNPSFDFILLDDVVNSLDGYKRPRLIQILKDYFADKQIVLLTHDSVWRDRIVRELPSWKRIHFKRHDIGSGPVMAAPETTLEQIEALILDDEPRQAGQLLGPLMEDELQDICEAFEVEVKYNRRNEYTLEPILGALKRRVESKLKPEHPVSKAVADLMLETGFRNLCAHAKNPDVDITPQEMVAVVTKWKAVIGHVWCPDAACGRLLRWADPEFRCGCGKAVLKRP